jgi:thiol-disulfide isomerase/thioredoxin
MPEFLVNIPHLEQHDINKKTINKNLSQGKPMFMMIYADWCGYCSKAKPHFQQASEIVKDKVTFIAICADGKYADKGAYEKIKNVFPVNGFPTFIVFDSSGNVKTGYSGERTVNSFVEFCNKL